jgi:phosphoribosylanthranilate isomerase
MSKIKICGLSRIEDITAVNQSLPDYIGFVFAPSRRRIDRETAAMLKERLDPRVKAVGVFVDENPDEIMAFKNIIDIIQLHGSEDERYIKKLKSMTDMSIIKAGGEISSAADYLLFDNATPGSGKTFDWSALGGVGRPYFLAGGLNGENIPEAIRLLSPYCIDVSSGAETDGRKDALKIEQIVRMVKG